MSDRRVEWIRATFNELVGMFKRLLDPASVLYPNPVHLLAEGFRHRPGYAEAMRDGADS